MFTLAPLFVAVAVVFVFFRMGDQLSPEVIFVLGWTGGLSLAASVGLTVRWLLRGGWRRSRPDRYEASVPHPYERGRSF
jgi:hypothetical protein